MKLAPKYDNVFVVAPPNTVTGGPEALHQLVHNLTQSAYAADHLAHKGIESHPLSDYLKEDYGEAAICGACIVVGRRGAAAFDKDVPFDGAYRLDETDPAFEDRFGDLVKSIFSDFESHRVAFDGYRRQIRSKKERFIDQLRGFFFESETQCDRQGTGTLR